MKHIEACIEKLEQCADPVTRETARELVRALLSFHGTALAKIVELGALSGGAAFIQSLADDPIASPALLLYDLHPTTLETRVLSALEKVRPQLQAHGGGVELVSIENGRVTLRLQGACQGCPTSSVTMRSTIDAAIYEAAPDVHAIEVA